MTAHTDAREPDVKWYHAYLDRDWMRLAACRHEDPEMWFPRQQEGHPTRDTRTRRRREKALTICFSCPVVEVCLAYAISVDARYGIWGGVEERDRAQITGKCLRR